MNYRMSDSAPIYALIIAGAFLAVAAAGTFLLAEAVGFLVSLL